jgi:hypothetical protein
VKGWKTILQANIAWKQAIILICDKADFKHKELVRRDKRVHLVLTKGTIHQENITIVNIYTLNISTPNFIRKR